MKAQVAGAYEAVRAATTAWHAPRSPTEGAATTALVAERLSAEVADLYPWLPIER